MRRNNKLIIVISIVFALAIVGAIFGYLFLATDIFKSNEELFAKYIQQNTEAFQKMLDFQTFKVYDNLKEQDKYESNTNVKMIHSEGGEISNPLNNLTVKLDIQKNDEEQYKYIDGQILYEDEEYLEAEIIKEEDIYGIRFTDAVKQFITVKEDENIENVANDIGIDIEQLNVLINGSEQIIPNESILVLKDKYSNILIEELKKGTFQKQKNAMITYNDITTETNAYSVSLSSKQVEDILLQILNNIKNETEILDKLQTIISKEDAIKQIDEMIGFVSEELEVQTIKVTVYEQKQKAIRTVIEIGTNKITIDNIEQAEGIKTKINYSNLSDEQAKEYVFEISKQNTENQEKVEINMNAINGEENYTIAILSQMQSSNNITEFNIQIDHKQGITTTSLVLENEVNVGNDFEKEQSLTEENNILISSLEQEKRKQLIDLLKQLVPQKINERIKLLETKFGIIYDGNEGIQNTENTESGDVVTQVEINKFNSKFEFYTGNEVSAENVKTLLDTVKNNISDYSIITAGDIENTETEETKVDIKLYIEKDKTNEEAMAKTLEKIDDNKKYKVLIFYKESNGLIDYITITEV